MVAGAPLEGTEELADQGVTRRLVQLVHRPRNPLGDFHPHSPLRWL